VLYRYQIEDKDGSGRPCFDTIGEARAWVDEYGGRVIEHAYELVDSRLAYESDDAIDQGISDYQLNTTMEGRQISSARDAVESELHQAGIIEDPDVDGGLLG
jgi:hypothetical protein